MPDPVTRFRAPDWRTRKLASEIPRLKGPCISCADCQGLCAELIEVMTLPDAIVRRDKPPRKDPKE